MRLSIANLLRKVSTNLQTKNLLNKESSVYVSNLSWLSGPNEVKDFFSRYGTVERVHLPLDFNQGVFRGFGFVQFKDKAAVQDAIHDQTRSQLDGRSITVKNN